MLIPTDWLTKFDNKITNTVYNSVICGIFTFYFQQNNKFNIHRFNF